MKLENFLNIEIRGRTDTRYIVFNTEIPQSIMVPHRVIRSSYTIPVKFSSYLEEKKEVAAKMPHGKILIEEASAVVLVSVCLLVGPRYRNSDAFPPSA